MLATEVRAAEALPFAITRPIRIAEVALAARDPETVAAWYRRILGLEPVGKGPEGGIALGAGGVPFLTIAKAPADAPTDDPREAGLFHTAFLLPSRTDLARWVRHAAENRFPIDGLADHLVSEAFYLTDPEGNGVEIYADRDPAAWKWEGRRVKMANAPIDFDALKTELGPDTPAYRTVPERTRIGHVHLRVGDAPTAEAWWNSEVGLDTAASWPGAAFLSSGGYHHHIAGNSWSSRGAAQRDASRTGLAYLRLDGPAIAAERELADPWGTVVRLSPAA